MRNIATIATLSIDDIDNVGFKTDDIDDSTLEQLAELMCDTYINYGNFENDLIMALKSKGIEKHE